MLTAKCLIITRADYNLNMYIDQSHQTVRFVQIHRDLDLFELIQLIIWGDSISSIPFNWLYTYFLAYIADRV